MAAPASIYDVAFAELTEQIPDLMWPTSVFTYGRMRTDPQIAADLAAYTLPIRRAAWVLDPAGARPEVVAEVSRQIGLRVAGDTQPAPGSAVRWADFIRLGLLHLVYGHMPFEKTYDTSDGRTARLAGLTERLPQTLSEIRVDYSTNGLSWVTQWQVMGQPMAKIPANALVWFVNEREGAAYQGRSLLRPAFGPWLIKHEMWRVHGTSIRRFGMGVPNVEAPPGATPQQIAESAALASAARVGETAGVGLPAGFRLHLTGLTGNVPDTLAFIQYLDQQVARSALAGFLDLGQSEHGSHALGATLVDLLMLSEQSIADHMAETINADLIRDIVTLNFGPDELAPVVTAGDVGSRHEVTAEAIQSLVACGAIQPDASLDAYLRQMYTLPSRSSEWRDPASAPAAPPAATPVAAASGRAAPRPTRAAAATGSRRQPTTVEAAAQTDFDQVEAQWQSAVDELLAEWDTKVAGTARAELRAQVHAAVTDDDLPALLALTAAVPAADTVLKDAMLQLAAAAAQEMVDEADRQGVTIDQPAVDESRIAAVALTVAGLAAAGLAASAARKAVQLATPGADADEVAAAVNTFLEGLSGAGLKDLIGGAMSNAQNTGRLAVLAAAPTAEYYASEFLDANTCGPCQVIDGQQFASLADAEAAYANGGYNGCDGGMRCRGIVVAVWSSAAEQAA